MLRRSVAHQENHERWLVSYADFITLLFAFFVVMFATAQKDKTKARVVAESVREALEHGQLSAAITGIINHRKIAPDGKGDSRLNPATAPPPNPAAPSASVSKDLAKPTDLAKQADLAKPLEVLQRSLESELKTGKVSMKLDQRGLVISLREAAFFASGDDAVNSNSLPILAKISRVIGDLSNPVRLEGHTDSVPIHNSRFHSNWELSTARSIAMLELLRQKYAFPEDRMYVAGFGENSPADTNGTEEGRSHNRRVDLVVLSKEATKVETPTGR